MRRRTTFRFGEHRAGQTGTTDQPLLTTVVAGRAGLPDGIARLVGRLDGCLRELHAVQRDLDEHVRHRRGSGLPVDESIMAHLADTTRHARRRLAGEQQALLSQPDLAPARLAAVEPVLRYGVATIAHVRDTVALCAAEPTSDGSSAVATARVERQLLDVFGLTPGEWAASVTASGMGAYSLVENVVLRQRLSPGDTVLLAPGIDRDVAVQICSLPFVRALPVTGHGVAELVDAVLRLRPRCVFADPLSGTAGQRMVNVPDLVRRLRYAGARTTVVVDGTAMSGVLPAALPAPEGDVEILYYERGAALQLGVDVGVGGAVAYPARLRSLFERQRRNAGLAPHRTGLELFPRYDREYYQERAVRTAAVALRTARVLSADDRIQTAARVCHTGLADHPDAGIAQRLGGAGSRITIACRRRRDGLELLHRVADTAVVNARQAGVDITAAHRAGGAPVLSVVPRNRPFLLLCPGDRDDRADVVAEALASAFGEVAR